MIRVLERVAAERGFPHDILIDNGPEFTSKALDFWAWQRGSKLRFIRPGNPSDNAFIESSNGKFRDECLNTHWFLDLDDARSLVERRRHDYNHDRPHSSPDNLTPMEFANRAGLAL